MQGHSFLAVQTRGHEVETVTRGTSTRASIGRILQGVRCGKEAFDIAKIDKVRKFGAS